MSQQRWYLDGSPGVGGEERHGADCAGLHGKSQQEVKLLHINLALLEQNLKCVWVGVRSGEAVAVSHDPWNIDLISNNPPQLRKVREVFLSFVQKGLGLVVEMVAGGGEGEGGQCNVSKSEITT